MVIWVAWAGRVKAAAAKVRAKPARDVVFMMHTNLDGMVARIGGR